MRVDICMQYAYVQYMARKRTANLLGTAALAIADRLEAAMTEAVGAGASAPAALVTLISEPGIGVSRLGGFIGLSQPAAARLVAALVDRGLIERRDGPDGRTQALYASAKGRAAVADALAAREQVTADLVAGLAPEDAARLSRVLEAMLTQLLARDGRPCVLCRLCDHAACIADGALCPVSAAARARGL